MPLVVKGRRRQRRNAQESLPSRPHRRQHLRRSAKLAHRPQRPSIYKEQRSIRGYSPLRGKGALKFAGPLSTVAYPFYSPLATSKAILSRDFNDCRTADLIIANFLPHDGLLGEEGTPPSLGTVMEVGFAYALQVPVLAVREFASNPVASHAMVKSAVAFWAISLDEAADMACSILLP